MVRSNKQEMGRTQKICIAVGLLIVMATVLSQYKNALTSQYTVNELKFIDIQEKKIQLPENTKTILYWTPMFQELNFNLGLGAKIFENCTFKNCYTTYHKDELPNDEFDAILFHGVEYKAEIHGKPKKRNPNQVYIFSIQESPIYSPQFIKDYNNFYNWTMTYRLDSDILRPYGSVEKRNTSYHPPSVQEIKAKEKKIAWFVSNCGTSSERERIYNEIQKHVPVDVYGSCGDFTCPKSNSKDCYDILEKEYKFYLSFENSICEDYVTEKLYNVLKRDIIPIVYGGADYSTSAPPHSVINVMDFKSIQDLVEYIRYLDVHPEEYVKYFEWKKDYFSSTSNDIALCMLCEKLNKPIKPKVYSDLDKWWKGLNLDKCSRDFVTRFL